MDRRSPWIRLCDINSCLSRWLNSRTAYTYPCTFLKPGHFLSLSMEVLYRRKEEYSLLILETLSWSHLRRRIRGGKIVVLTGALKFKAESYLMTASYNFKIVLVLNGMLWQQKSAWLSLSMVHAHDFIYRKYWWQYNFPFISVYK